ncbi:serine/threonine-protein kinase [Streptosporangium sp. NPDC004379]|uniref:serine/threonine-protein kinase n=1 Tax=Streptosporangium sp. NPDC004379 TaxID=3366189 RepID=UPI0036C5E66D
MPEQQRRLLANRYELIAPIGRGTMGTVWRAYDRSLGREVAIKEIRQERGLSDAQRAELRERMIREGRTAARIGHPSVATVHDAIIEGDSPWIIMELVHARSLEQVIEEEGPLPPRLVAEIGVDLLGALRAAHAQGVLHRDVKPGNVLLTESGRVVLTDFGIAKAEGDDSLTSTGMVIGSPGYTPPERARGEYTGPESDLWSLGATLYFAVEGRPAYERSSVSETLAALMTDRVDPPVLAGPLRPVLERLLERDFRARPEPGRAMAMLRAVADAPAGPAAPGAGHPASPDEIPSTGTFAARPVPSAPPAPHPSASPVPQPTAFRAPEPSPHPAPQPPRPSPQPPRPPQSTEPPRPPGTAAPKTGRPATPPYGLPASRPAASGAAPSAPSAPGGASPAPRGPAGTPPGEDGEFDADRTMVVARPQGGLRLPARDQALGSHDRPPGGPGTASPARGPSSAQAFPPRAPAAPGPANEGAADTRMLPPVGAHGDPGGPGAPWDHARGPGAAPGARLTGDQLRSHGLGTDLFAIAGQGGKGVQNTTPPRTRIGLIALLGIAAVALIVIIIMAVAAFA